MLVVLQNVLVLFVWRIFTANASNCPDTDNIIQMCQDESKEGSSLYIDSSKRGSIGLPCQCLMQTRNDSVNLTITAHAVPKNCHSSLTFTSFNFTANCNEEKPAPTTHLLKSDIDVSVMLSSTNELTWGNFCISLDVISTTGGNVSVICKGQKDGKNNDVFIAVSFIVVGVFAAIFVLLVLLGICLYLRNRWRVKKRVERLRKSKIKYGYENKGMVMTHL